MKGRPSIWVRAQRLEATRCTMDHLEVARRLAAERGRTAEEVLADAAALQRRAQVAGAVTNEALVTFVAQERGIPETELWVELERVWGETDRRGTADRSARGAAAGRVPAVPGVARYGDRPRR